MVIASFCRGISEVGLSFLCTNRQEATMFYLFFQLLEKFYGLNLCYTGRYCCLEYIYVKKWILKKWSLLPFALVGQHGTFKYLLRRQIGAVIGYDRGDRATPRPTLVILRVTGHKLLIPFTSERSGPKASKNRAKVSKLGWFFLHFKIRTTSGMLESP